MSRSDPNADTIDFVIDFWDVPVEGIGTFHGTPCHFRVVFDDALDEYSNRYDLFEVSDETRQLALDAAGLWRKHDRLPQSPEWDALIHDLAISTGRDREQNPAWQARAEYVRVGTGLQDRIHIVWHPLEEPAGDK